ncbi:phosphocholine-specific phospholipase C [Arenibacter certesii]|uniref:phospholipase C n=1 Tax=Arenibacter certesii TaxID=228955 RepID=A0A918MRM4_9FLAO|nr:phospholipase C, phosphocholine-specific [Arenibacter certesii]GGW48529.1 hypothetical protein GCM10007383_35760 [Arenibacter certesii]
MDNRRDFLKKAGMLTGGLGLLTTFPPSIQRALAIDPEKGSTFYDAEHVVLLMQENRSFDHCFGTLQGVRGFNDPRAIDLPNKIPVWLQSNKKGETFVPFRLNIKDTKATWMGSLPHSWEDQVDARNDGKYDQWLEAKKPGNKDYQHMPLTMGYYNREDIPFYYSMADAFTVFDQHFCSSLTGTTANRHFFWSGKIRETPTSKSCVRNSDVYYHKEASWKTFPERLEEHGISWQVYQNELSLQTELTGEDEALLSNFTNNNLEWFSQYNVRYSEGHQNFLKKRHVELPSEIEELEVSIKQQPANQVQKLRNTLEHKKSQLKKIKEELHRWSPENFNKLSEYEKNLHRKGLATNTGDPHYHETETLNYEENGVERTVKVPKGDILHQFREDVKNDRLPAVSWVVAPKNFSDHPSAPWYGAWYVSEVLDILTKNPEIWKKTIFILTYDENDGYFDHVPPFVAPNPKEKNAVSKGIDTSEEYVTLEEELAKEGLNPKNARESPVGLGYRVPMIIASPWSKGGWVNSEICDISSTLMFLEKFLSNKTNIKVEEPNISSWRRTICGDLTSSFRKFDGEKTNLPEFLERNTFMQQVYNASFRDVPSNFKALSSHEIEQAAKDNYDLPFMPKQEQGVRDSSALSYELYTDGGLDRDKSAFAITFKASDDIFGKRALSAPFNVYAPGNYLQENASGKFEMRAVKTWPFAVKAGDTLTSTWPLDNFENKEYHLRVYGPNGFYREFSGNDEDPHIITRCGYQKKRGFLNKLSGNIRLDITNTSKSNSFKITIEDNAYGNPKQSFRIRKNDNKVIIIPAIDSYGWYDFSIHIKGFSTYSRRYAGRIETGKHSKSDPFMGGEKI